MSEEMADPWREILLEAIEANSTQPVIGTHFRKAVNSAAAKRGLQFPPSEEPELRFSQLLERYPNVVSILRRPGQDFLVAPTGRSDLLAQGIQRELYGIRNDLFGAFTVISDDRPYYDKTADRVVWQKPSEGLMLPDSLVPIEPASLEAEIQLRRNFAESITEPTSRSLLLSALTDPHPLQAFGRSVKEALLQKKWHSFRTERLLAKMQHWARVKEIEWKGVWLTEKPTNYIRKNQTFSRETAVRVEGDSLQLLFSGLDAADIQRISIPLDLVLKAISSSRKR